MIKPWSEESARHNNAALKRFLENCHREAALYDALKASRKAKTKPLSEVERARAYIKKEPASVGGAGGSKACFHVACQLVWGFALSHQQALEAIRDWNARCTDTQGKLWPWSEKELLHKFDSALNKAHHKEPRGYLLHQDRDVPRNGAANGHSNGHANGHADEAHKFKVPEVRLEDVATFADLAKAGAEVRWLWENWIMIGALTAVAAQAGVGKTRFIADLCRRIAHGLSWPDGQPMHLPKDSRSLWVVSDNHHDQMVQLCTAYGLLETAYVNAVKTEPYEGVLLDTPEDVANLESRIAAVRPVIVIVDTVGGATSKNLCRQEEAQQFYHPLQVLARKYNCAIAVITHLNAAGKLLGRRGTERVRVELGLSQPNQADPTLRLEVTKTMAKRPAALGVIMGDEGNEYSEEAPKEAAGDRSRTAKDLDRAAEWLGQFLAERPAESLRCVDLGNKALGVDRELKWWRDAVLKGRLQGKSQRMGYAGGGSWWFTLPAHPWPFPGLEASKEAKEAIQPEAC